MKETVIKKKNWKKRSRYFNIQKERQRAAKLLRRRTRRKKKGYSSIYNKGISDRKQVLNKMFPGYKQIDAPYKLSLLNNESDTLKFLQKLQSSYSQQKKVAVLLDHVKEITTDAILVLLSNMVHFKAAHIGFNGTKPTDKYVAAKLEASGFFKHLYGQVMRDQESYSFRKMDNYIYTHGQKTVEAKIADDLVKYASETVWGTPRRCPGIQSTLVELMHNTHDHAGEYKGEKHWWLSVEHDEKNKVVTFSFIDFGVGIFRSLENKKPGEPLYGAMDYIVQHFPLISTEADRLQLILEGKVRLTQFNEYYRGKGLRNIYLRNKRGHISELAIISNYASFKAVSDNYHSIRNEFDGTFISFKMNQKTYNLQWEI